MISETPRMESALGAIADRRKRKIDRALATAAKIAWDALDKSYDYVRRELEWILRSSGGRTLGTIYQAHLVPRDLPLDEVQPIIGKAYIQSTNVLLVTNDSTVLMSWKFDECEELVVTDDNQVVAFVTGRDDGSELVMLTSSNNELGWLTRIAWRCHQDGATAAIEAINALQVEHHRNRP